MPTNFGFGDKDDDAVLPTAFRHYENTVVSQSLRSSDTTADSNSSKAESLIQELSRAEERSLRLSGSQFTPIQNPPEIVITGASVDFSRQSQQEDSSDWNREINQSTDESKYKSLSSWKPSEDITRRIEGTSGIRRTKDWDSNGLEVEAIDNHPSVSTILSTTRQSTPDSVMNTGQLLLNGGTGSASSINRSNLPENSAFESPTSPSSPIGVSMRHVVTDMNRNERMFNSIFTDNVEHDELSSPRSPIGISMRNVVTGMNRYDRMNSDDVRPEEIELHTADKDGGDLTSGKDSASDKEDKGTPMLVTKMISFIFVVMMLLAGIIVLIVLFKDKVDPNRAIGRILPNPIQYIECPDVDVRLGENVTFSCRFDLTHAHRAKLKNYINFEIAPVGRSMSEQYLQYKVSKTDDGKLLSLKFTSDGWVARCITEGLYFIYLKNATKAPIHTANVTVGIKGSTLQTTFEQHLHETCPVSGEVRTYFKATCSISNDCNSYKASIYRRIYGGSESLDGFMSCQKNFSDEAGYSLRCSGDIPDHFVIKDSALICRVNSQERTTSRGFVLPECSRTPTCVERTPEKPYPFNCSAKSNHVAKLMNASCNFNAVRNCLKPGRKIFNLYKNDTGDLLCRQTPTSVPVCRLSWCRDYSVILKDTVPGQLFCGGDFVEQEYEYPTETTALPPATTSSTDT